VFERDGDRLGETAGLGGAERSSLPGADRLEKVLSLLLAVDDHFFNRLPDLPLDSAGLWGHTWPGDEERRQLWHGVA
jgi:hypothetical protein